MDLKHAVIAAVMGVCFALCVVAVSTRSIRFRYYPSIKFSGVSALSIAGCAALFILCMLPVFLNIKEDIQWRFLRSRV